jgi:beta-glucosidase
MKCIVLDVSGRPLDITGIVPEANAIVASWLPGSEGAGVADVLFGNKAFTGRLPVTWVKAESQLPLNVGDKNYDPLYPYGWGLRTDSARNRLQKVRDQLQVQPGTSPAVKALNSVLTAKYWNSDGSARKADEVLALLKKVGAAMADTAKYSFTQQDLVVSVARDLAQAAIVARGASAMTATATLTSGAEHSIVSGQPAEAITALIKARSAALQIPSAGSGRLGGSGRAAATPRR